VLLNFSRDSLVVADDLKRALKEKKLHAYVTDFPIDELIGVDGVTLIPHLGASTKEAEENCAIMAVKQTMDYLENGIIVNSVNFPEATPGVKTTASRICVLNKNIPAMLGKLTGTLAEMNVNIAKLINKSKGDLAYTVIDTDQKVNAKKLTDALDIKGIISVRVL
jgi:D-3-phosphoglycerate dehydrogenase